MIVRGLSIDVSEVLDQLGGKGGFAQNQLRDWGTEIWEMAGFLYQSAE